MHYYWPGIQNNFNDPSNKKDRWDSRKPRPPINSLLGHPASGGNTKLATICIRYIFLTTQRLSDLDVDLSGSLKVTFDSVIRLSIYGFLLMINSNIWPNSAPLRDIRLWNPHDLDFDLSRSLKTKNDCVIGLPIYGSY